MSNENRYEYKKYLLFLQWQNVFACPPARVSIKIDPPEAVEVKDSPSLLEQLEIEAEFETNISRIRTPDELKVEVKDEQPSFDAQNNVN